MLVRLIKAVNYRAVNVDDRHNLGRKYRISFEGTFVACRAREARYAYLSIHQDGHNNLTLRVAVARNVPRERVHVSHELRLASRSRRTTDSTAECDDLASDFALERPQDELRPFACCCP